MSKKIDRLRELTSQLHDASIAYYKYDKPVMSDTDYDALYDELEASEKELGISLAGSPTQKVQGYVLDGFKKVTHSKPMLSAAKTKDPAEIQKFLGNHKWYCSFKLDGLTTVLRYKDGKFIQGITRGNGLVGEDVTEACRFINNIPMKIFEKGDVEVRGETGISWGEFDRINSELEEPYSHPRNLAAGTLRNLDLNVVKDRELSFVAFELVSPEIESKWNGMSFLDEQGFETVKRIKDYTVEQTIKIMNPEEYKYPCDGLIFELDSLELSKSLGKTAHHESCRMALKWADDMYETVLENVEWNPSRNGSINPVAVFSPVDLDGAITSRATLHNITYIKNLKLGIGDRIHVYRSNMVIPRVHDSIDKSNNIPIPSTCPVCGAPTKIVKENDSEILVCTGDNCAGKLLGRFCNAVKRDALNIEGLSEATLQKFINLGWIASEKDIYHLADHKTEMQKLEGFGKKSVEKLLKSIENSRNITLDRFLLSLSIPLLGKSASKDIAKACSYSFTSFVGALMAEGRYAFTYIDGIGNTLGEYIYSYWNKHGEEIVDLANEFSFEKKENNSSGDILSGKTFVITGTVNHYENRDALKAVIEANGGKVSGSVSAKTNYLINNDINSNSSKNKKAKELGVPIITEDDFIKMLGE